MGRRSDHPHRGPIRNARPHLGPCGAEDVQVAEDAGRLTSESWFLAWPRALRRRARPRASATIPPRSPLPLFAWRASGLPSSAHPSPSPTKLRSSCAPTVRGVAKAVPSFLGRCRSAAKRRTRRLHCPSCFPCPFRGSVRACASRAHFSPSSLELFPSPGEPSPLSARLSRWPAQPPCWRVHDGRSPRRALMRGARPFPSLAGPFCSAGRLQAKGPSAFPWTPRSSRPRAHPFRRGAQRRAKDVND